ncbi:MAG TPA: YdcF family protein [Sphingomonadaceae bacterium]
MIVRLIAAAVLAWLLGFAAFALALPGPAGDEKTDAIVVPTGAVGRIDRGLQQLERGNAKAMLVTGVGREVKPREFAVEYKVAPRLMACCVTLGFSALNTKGNAAETAGWMRRRRFTSLRLVTTDWHMRRAELELKSALPPGITVVDDAVRSKPSPRILFLEYNKLIASFVSQLVPR